MQNDNRLFEDLSRVASGAMSAMSGLRDEFETAMREQFERFLGKMDLVKREEFEAVKAMAQRAREEQEVLQAKLDALLAAGAAPAPKRAAKPRAPKA